MTAPHLPLTLLLAAMVGIVPFSIDAYLPALADMSVDFGVALHELELTVSVFLFGYALGSLVGGPLCDHYGRRLIGLTGMAMFVVCSAAITQVDSYGGLMGLRFAQAIGGGFTTVVVPAIVRDLYDRETSAKVLTTIAFIMLAAPLLAPIFGTGILALWGWPPIFIFLAVYGSALWLIAQRHLPHSRSASQRRARLNLAQILSDYRFVAANREARPFLIAMTCSQGVFLTYITHSAFLVIEYLGMAPHQFPQVFCVFVLGLMVANRLNAWLLKRHDSMQVFIWGARIVFVTSVALLVCSLWLSAQPLWVMACLFVLVASIGFINSNAQANFLHFFPEHSGTANALARTCQLGAGGLLGAAASALYDGGPLPIAVVMCAGATVAFWASRQVQSRPLASAATDAP